MVDLEELGGRIRRLRLAAEMTQEELAERSDLTAGFISQVERGKTSISIDSLMMILETLNVHISDFFRPTEERIVFTDEDTIDLEREGVSHFLSLVPGAASRTMEPVKVTLAPGERARLDPFSGEQFGYVLKGEINIAYGGQKTSAKKGESFYSAGMHEIKITGAGRNDSEYLWITSPPYF